MKFSEMKYSRIDISDMGKEYDKITDCVKKAESADDVFHALSEHEKLSKDYGTMSNIAYIRYSINTEDKFYDDENTYYDEHGPVLQEKVNNFLNALLCSPYKKDIEKKYGTLLFDNLEMDLKCFSPEVIPLLQEENKLVSDYQKLIASAQIEFDGKTLNISQLGVYKTDANRETRKKAYTAEGDFYMSHSGTLDEIFDKLVKVRTEIARKLGFNNFTELGYMRRTRNCYNAEAVKKFRNNVVKYFVPLDKELKKKQAERIGVDTLMLYDDNFFYKEGNAKPQGTAEDILAAGKQMYSEMSKEAKEFIEFMYDNELLDVKAKKGKAVGGYCTGIPNYKAPFIFSNFNGTSGDVDVLTHEAGHAFADFQVRDFELEELKNPTMESCETHSMSMEFLSWPWWGLFYGNDVTKARISHLEDALFFIPYGCMVDHFQHIVYDNPELTPNQRNEKWAELEKTYRPYLDMTGMSFYGEGRGWQRQLHIYHYPFYYIDYCLAQTESLEFWYLSQSDYKNAFEKYMKFVRQGGKQTFVELCKTAGIDNPFMPDTLKNIADCAKNWLDTQRQ